MPTILSKSDKAIKPKSNKKLTGWDNAIADAEYEIRRLENSINTFKKMKAAGEPWPGEKKQDAATN